MIFDWPSQALRQNHLKQLALESKNVTILCPNSPNFNSTGEGNSIRKTSINQLNVQKNQGNLSKRQNVLPLMTQRVISKSIILCKVPIAKNDFLSFQDFVQPLANTQISPKANRYLDTSPIPMRQKFFSDHNEYSPPITQRQSFNQISDTLRKEFENKLKIFNNRKNSNAGYTRTTQLLKSAKLSNQVIIAKNTQLRLTQTIEQKSSNKQQLQKNVQPKIYDQSSQIRKGDENQSNNLKRVIRENQKGSQYTRKEMKQQQSTQDLQAGLKKPITSRMSYRNNQNTLKSAQNSQIYNRRFTKVPQRLESSTERIEPRETSVMEGLEHQKKQKPLLQIQLQHQQSKRSDQSEEKFNKLKTMRSMEEPDFVNNMVYEVELNEILQQQAKYKEYSFPMNIIMLIIQYNMDELHKLQLISASWYTVINEAMDHYSNYIENQFNQKHSSYLNFIKSYNSITPIKFCNKKGIRIDRIFQCEIINNSSIINQTMSISYDFGYLQNKEDQIYGSEYRLDIIPQGKQRITWIHLSDELPPYSQNELQVSPGDTIDFAVCIYNMNGIVDISGLIWDSPQLFQIPKNERDPLTYNRDIKIIAHKNDRKTKVHCNTNRLCEVEDAVPEWINVGQRDQPRIPIDIQQYQKRFNILQTQFNELDQHYNKIVLQTKRRGVVESDAFGENMIVQVKGKDEPILNEIKKRGVIFDRNKGKEKIQLRVNDLLVVYNSKSIPIELQPKIVFSQSCYNSKASAYSSQKIDQQYPVSEHMLQQ